MSFDPISWKQPRTIRMNLTSLVTAFQSITQRIGPAPDDANRSGVGAERITPTTAQKPNNPAPPSPNVTDNVTDQVSLSSQAAFKLAAQKYNPREITPIETRALTDALHQNLAISARDRAIILSSSEPAKRLFALKPAPDAPQDLVETFQRRLATGAIAGDIPAVDANSRALSILGRLVSLREVDKSI
ncbi:MAG: hypothetical protein HOM25_10970 [Rhodospirillaceae bacterium]|nr:hypothetical protein [Rhodospirillaceae bacterium]MBT5663783.1 hypothetical protein [Rhodospirillaceae bacterium]